MAPRRPPVALLSCLVSCECVVCMTLGLCGEEPRCRSLPFFQSSAPAILTVPTVTCGGQPEPRRGLSIQICCGCQAQEPVKRNAPVAALEPSAGLVLLRTSVTLYL